MDVNNHVNNHHYYESYLYALQVQQQQNKEDTKMVKKERERDRQREKESGRISAKRRGVNVLLCLFWLRPTQKKGGEDDVAKAASQTVP